VSNTEIGDFQVHSFNIEINSQSLSDKRVFKIKLENSRGISGETEVD
jgi:hypothetical protein